MAIQRVAIVYRPQHQPAAELAQAVLRKLPRYSIEGYAASAETWQAAAAPTEDLIIVMGGDGTIISTARQTAPFGIPLLGINFGHVGFLTELQPSEVDEELPFYLRGECRIEERSMLTATIDGTPDPRPLLALNDIVVVRGAEPRVVRLRVLINGEFYHNFTADGVIMATATGSTAYNLAAGGPILHPFVQGSVLTAIAPHLAVDRPLILEPEAVVQMELLDASNDTALLSADGQITLPLTVGQRVTISRSQYVTRFMRRRSQNDFFRVLSAKLTMAASPQGDR